MTTLIEKKIKKQIFKGIKPKILFLDLDGTIFKENYEIIFAPFYNLQTLKLLKTYSIPFCIVTGRLFWNYFDEIEMYLHGLPEPDAIILKDGTEILLRRENNKLIKDDVFLKNKLALTSKFSEITNFKFTKIDPYLYVTHINNINIKTLLTIKASITKKYKNLWNLSYSESLRKINTKETFSGTLFLKDKNIGKDSTIEYLLSTISSRIKEKIDIFIFGDASIDIPMLSLKKTKQYDIHSFLVNPKPLAQDAALKNKNINIIKSSGPKVILEIIKNFTSNKNIIKQKESLSKAQNNPTRKLILFFEPLLNKIIDQKLSANDISILGLKKTIRGINLIYDKKNIFQRIYGLFLFTFGNFIDILDGIRSRAKQTNKQKLQNLDNISGQIVDVFCDRSKEFYFFYKKTQFSNILSKQSSHALSCILPSIARAANEVLDKAVSEKDEKGGSMLDRVKLMFKSIFFYAFGLYNISKIIDNKIYLNNLETFNNRIKNIDFNKFKNLNFKDLNDFQKKALNRLVFLLKLYYKELDLCSENYKIKLIPNDILELQSMPILKSVNLKNKDKLFKIFKQLI